MKMDAAELQEVAEAEKEASLEIAAIVVTDGQVDEIEREIEAAAHEIEVEEIAAEQEAYLDELPESKRWPCLVHPFPPMDHTLMLHERVERLDGVKGTVKAVYTNGVLVRFETGACYTVRPDQVKSVPQVLQ